MIQKFSEPTSAVNNAAGRRLPSARGLQTALWAIWALAVIAGGAFGWWADIGAGQPFSILGMAIDAFLVGVVGLVVITVVEMRLEPWRFLE